MQPAMTRTRLSLAAIAVAVLLPMPALASFADAKACSDDLSPSAQEVYRGSLKAMRDGRDPREAVGAEVRRLVSSGRLKQDNARDVTDAAVQCMRLLRC